jgi:hypothetical protein
MTVTSTSYSLLEEVWGEPFDKPIKKKKTVKFCDERQSKRVQKFDDIMDTYYPNSSNTYEEYNKSEFTRPNTREPREVHVENYAEPSTSERTVGIKSMEDKEKQYLDMGMYVFSGVALIFIMEQFIQIGMKMKF